MTFVEQFELEKQAQKRRLRELAAKLREKKERELIRAIGASIGAAAREATFRELDLDNRPHLRELLEQLQLIPSKWV
jgi:uncharacterized protein with von Willebrand factor type A (vWA) domain